MLPILKKVQQVTSAKKNSQQLELLLQLKKIIDEAYVTMSSKTRHEFIKKKNFKNMKNNEIKKLQQKKTRLR